jgi:hypothetical protein
MTLVLAACGNWAEGSRWGGPRVGRVREILLSNIREEGGGGGSGAGGGGKAPELVRGIDGWERVVAVAAAAAYRWLAGVDK